MHKGWPGASDARERTGSSSHGLFASHGWGQSKVVGRQRERLGEKRGSTSRERAAAREGEKRGHADGGVRRREGKEGKEGELVGAVLGH